MSRLGLSMLAAVALAAAPLGGCIITDDDGDSSLTVQNDSSYLIYEIRVTDVGSTNWGPNLLGGDILRPGEALTILVDCGFYDVLLVDDTGADCVLYDLDLCFDDAVWVIDNVELDACVGSSFGKRSQTSAEASSPAEEANASRVSDAAAN